MQDQIAAVADARAKDIATRRIELTGVSAYPQLGGDTAKVAAWPAVPAMAAVAVAKPLIVRRLAATFEALRDAAENAVPQPRVFLAALGTPAEHGSRAQWITNLLASGGIAVIGDNGFTNSADAGRTFAESGATVACICGSDAGYAELGEATVMALKGAGAVHVALAGRPRDQEAALQAAGVDAFLHAGMDVVVALAALQRAFGISA